MTLIGISTPARSSASGKNFVYAFDPAFFADSETKKETCDSEVPRLALPRPEVFLDSCVHSRHRVAPGERMWVCSQTPGPAAPFYQEVPNLNGTTKALTLGQLTLLTLQRESPTTLRALVSKELVRSYPDELALQRFGTVLAREVDASQYRTESLEAAASTHQTFKDHLKRAL